MFKDQQYFNLPFKLSEIEHKYGDRVHILADPYLNTMLARLGHPSSYQPTLNHYIKTIYTHLFIKACSYCFHREDGQWDTRMKEFQKEGVFHGETFDPRLKAVVVDLARAGTFPSHICYEELNFMFNPENIRQDHFYLNRKTNEQDEVIGVDVSGSKIGGDQNDSYVFFPDPMGATGGSLSYCLDHYKKNVEGKARKYIALHLIITPEYIQRISSEHPDVEIFAARLDRGLSSEEVLKTVPGTHIEKEKGLNEKHYIVPGAGGVGEILNNSFV